VIDIGGSSVKLWHTGHQEHRKYESGKELTPERMVERTKETIEDWTYEAIALGLPVVSTPVGRAHELLSNPRIGRIANGEPMEFANAIREVLGWNRQSVRESARQVAQNLDFEKSANCLIEALKEV